MNVNRFIADNLIIYETTILPVVLYEYETWYLILGEERTHWGTGVFVNKVLRTFEPKRQDVTEGWRKLHNEFNNLYSSPNIIRLIKSRRMR
jgi:hypothetical protein